MKKEMIEYVPQKRTVYVSTDRHAMSGDLITPVDAWEPLYVLNSYTEPQYLEAYENGEITLKDLRRRGTGYVDAVGETGFVHRLQYYEYYLLVQRNYRDIIDKLVEKWKLDIEYPYEVNEKLDPSLAEEE